MEEVGWSILGTLFLVELVIGFFYQERKIVLQSAIIFYPVLSIIVLAVQYYQEWFRIASLGLLILGFIEMKRSYGTGEQKDIPGTFVFKSYAVYFALGIGLSRFTQFPSELILFLTFTGSFFDRLTSVLSLLFSSNDKKTHSPFHPIAAVIALLIVLIVGYWLNQYLLFPITKLILVNFFTIAFVVVGRIMFFRFKQIIGLHHIGTIFKNKGGIIDFLANWFALGGLLGILHFLYPTVLY